MYLKKYILDYYEFEKQLSLFQITEGLSFLHYTGHVLHRNVCPSSILVTKKGTWKLGGLEFTGRSPASPSSPFTIA